jgi:hypothetical protein
MLIDFSVTNYRSFRDRMTLSMVAASGGDPDDARVVVADERPAKPLRLLRSAAIYGPNGARKSNLVKALEYMTDVVLHSRVAVGDQAVRRVPFRLDPAYLDVPTEFEVNIHDEGERYTYGFALDSERVLEEWLYAGLPRTRLLFHREMDRVSFGASWKGDQAALVQRTRPDALLLSVAAQFNHFTAGQVWDWFNRRLWFVKVPNPYTIALLARSADLQSALPRFLDAADTGIVGLNIRPLRPNASSQDHYEVRTQRRVKDGSVVEFDLADDESAGTQRLVELARPWIDGLRTDAVVLADEFDINLHPRLSRFLLESWHEAGGKAQLILTTHNADLLSSDLLRRDQVWFVDKDKAQQTELYSLAEFRRPNGRGARATENHRAGYLAGRYGAVPVL